MNQMIRGIKLLMLTLVLIAIPWGLKAQVDFNKTPDDDLGNYEDKFQELFFEALKQKSIENFDRAIIALQQCLSLDDSKPVVYYEIGKNYVQLKNFGAAENALKKAVEMEPANEWYLDELYGVYAETNQVDKAVETVKQLVRFHPDYKEDLANLYFRNNKFTDALKLLDELDIQLGFSQSRDDLRNQIYNATGADQERIAYLEERITNNPDNERNYLNLIFRYSEQKQPEKAFEVAEKLLARKPDSQLVHLALYKFYLEAGQPEKAITSMKSVLKSGTIKADAKARVLADFVDFVKKNPQYEPDLLEVTTEVVSDDSGKSDAELAYYYLQNEDKPKALEYYLKAFDKNPADFEMLKNILLLRLDLRQFAEAESEAGEALDQYPAQPILYLIKGVAHNELKQADDAISVLEMGIDYIIENPKMEADFYRQLSLAHKLNNNIEQSEAFDKKARSILNEND